MGRVRHDPHTGGAVTLKVCKKCGRELPTDRFSRRKETKDGLQYKCHDCAREALREWRAANPQHREDAKRWREENKDRHAALHRLWYQENRERVLTAVQRWAGENPDKVAVKNQRRRAILQDAYVEDIDRSKLFDRDEGLCGICGLAVDDSWEIDHIVPLARGGTHEYANVRVAHGLCNRRKSNRLDSEIADLVELLRKEVAA
jgi:5-methylcytosine-specific restriction endonuclease McrA